MTHFLSLLWNATHLTQKSDELKNQIQQELEMLWAQLLPCASLVTQIRDSTWELPQRLLHQPTQWKRTRWLFLLSAFRILCKMSFESRAGLQLCREGNSLWGGHSRVWTEQWYMVWLKCLKDRPGCCCIIQVRHTCVLDQGHNHVSKGQGKGLADGLDVMRKKDRSRMTPRCLARAS